MRFHVLMAMAISIFVGVFAGPCYAQATRTWVSGTGDDANPCSRTAPCKTFAGAISKTAGGGEINCLDPAGFGALTINNSISILCDSVSNGGVLVSGTNGITVNLSAPTQRVVLSGLDFEGVSLTTSSAGLSAVNVIGQGQVIVRNCSIRDFSVAGVNMQGAASTSPPRVVVQNCLITNSGVGVNVAGSGGAATGAQVIGTLIEGNTTGISVAQGGTLLLSSSVVTGQPTAIAVSGGGQVISYGDNVINKAGTPTSTAPLQ